MKQLSFFSRSLGLAILLMTSMMVHAQLPDGSIAPDFTATDINGVEHNLYDLLDEGKKVLVQFSATWCGPCWSYHNTGVLTEIWETYGPDGTDEVYVFMIEGDDTTTLNDLLGTGSATQGDWTAGTGYPIIDDGGSIFDDYDGAYYPTIYTICPNRILTESSQITAAAHAEILFANDCAAATLAHDVALISYTGATSGCVGYPVSISAMIMNLGLDVMTSATFGLFLNGVEVVSTTWAGSLTTYQTSEVVFPAYAFDGDVSFEIRLTSSDMNDGNDWIDGAFDASTIATQFIRVEIGTDGWGEETGWTITDEEGTVVESVATGSLANTTEYTWELELPAEGCYQFVITDTYGDGIFGSQWGSIDGYCRVTSVMGFPVPTDEPEWSVILDYDGTYNFESLNASLEVDFNYGPDNGGCTDATAVNFDPEALFDDGSCIGLVDCSEIGGDFWATSVSFGVYPASSQAFLGEATWYSGDDQVVGWVLNVPNTVEDPASGVAYNVHSFIVEDVIGLPAGLSGALSADTLLQGQQACLDMTGFPSETGSFPVTISGAMSISIFGAPFPVGSFETTLQLDVVANPNAIVGCTYPGADNFNLIANQDDASCIFQGCTDASALNFHPVFNQEDSSCIYGANTGLCVSDFDSDGLVGAADLVVFLSEFGLTCQ
jgi:hypothetical protein